jgi:hypothetical protein
MTVEDPTRRWVKRVGGGRGRGFEQCDGDGDSGGGSGGDVDDDSMEDDEDEDKVLEEDNGLGQEEEEEEEKQHPFHQDHADVTNLFTSPQKDRDTPPRPRFPVILCSMFCCL